MDVLIIESAFSDDTLAEQRRWRRHPVGSGLALVRRQSGQVALEPLDETMAPERAKLATILAFSARHAALMGAGGLEVYLNGSRPLPVAVLEDRDEITVVGMRLLFAAFAATDAYVMGDQGLCCARCKNVITAGEVARDCPACAAVYHCDQTVTAPGLSPKPSPGCYDYDPVCLSCERSWATLHWNPGDDDAEC